MLRRLLISGLALILSIDFHEPIKIIESNERPIVILGIGTYTQEQVFPPHLSRYTVCLWMNMEALWRIGDTAETLSRYVSNHSVLTIDNTSRPFDITSNSLAVIHFKYDENNKLLGSYGDNGIYCYGIDGLSAGLHEAIFETEAPDGEHYSYAFQLQVR